MTGGLAQMRPAKTRLSLSGAARVASDYTRSGLRNEVYQPGGGEAARRDKDGGVVRAVEGAAAESYVPNEG